MAKGTTNATRPSKLTGNRSNTAQITVARLIQGAGLTLLLPAIWALFSEPLVNVTPMGLWFLAAFGLGLIAFGTSGTYGAWGFARLAFILIVGGAAQLWLTDARWFPSLRLRPTSVMDVVSVSIIILQVIYVLTLLWRTVPLRSTKKLLMEFGTVRILVFLLVSGLFTVSPQNYLVDGEYISYVYHLIAGAGLFLVNILTITALLAQSPPSIRFRPSGPILPAIMAISASSLLTWFAFERVPHVQDEVAYLFQAKTYLGGNLTVPAPPDALSEALEHYLLEIRNGRWYSTMPPGWPAILSLGLFLKMSWILNPLLAGLSVLLSHGITRRLLDRDKADLVAILLACSPWYLGTAGSLMSHNVALAGLLLCWWFLLLSRECTSRGDIWALLGGLAMGWVFVTRPIEGLTLGILTGAFLLLDIQQPKSVVRIASYALGCILSGSVFLVNNLVITGNIFTDPLKQYFTSYWGRGSNAYGFGKNIGSPDGWYIDIQPGHSFFEGMMNTFHSMSVVQLDYLGWGVGSLALVWGSLLFKRFTKIDLMLGSIILTTITAAFLYWFSGSFYIGTRYWFAIILPLSILSACGYEVISDKLSHLGIPVRNTASVIGILCLFGLLVITPWRGVSKYFNYQNYSAATLSEYDKGTFENNVVFFTTDEASGTALFLNDPWLRSDRPLFLKDLGEDKNALAINALPERSFQYFQPAKNRKCAWPSIKCTTIFFW